MSHPSIRRIPAPPIAAEAVGGALYSLLYDHVNRKGPETLPHIVPVLG